MKLIKRQTYLFVLIIFLSSFGFGQKTISENSLVLKADSLVKQGKYSEAIEILDKVIQKNPKNATAFYLRADSKFFNRDFKGSMMDYDKTIILTPNAVGIEKVYNNRGVLHSYLGENEKALSDYTKAISINPKYADSYNGRGNIYLHRGELEKALADYNKSIELNPTSMPSYDGRASIHFFKGDFDKSLADLDKALELVPESAGSTLLRGILLGLKGYWFSSTENLKKAVEINIKSNSPFSGNIKTTLSDLDKYISVNERNAKAFAVRGFIKLFQNKETESIEDFNKAFELNSNLRKDLADLIEPVKTRLND